MTPSVFKMTECCWTPQALYKVIMCEERDKSPRWNIIGNEFADQEFKSLDIHLSSNDYNKPYNALLGGRYK